MNNYLDHTNQYALELRGAEQTLHNLYNSQILDTHDRRRVKDLAAQIHVMAARLEKHGKYQTRFKKQRKTPNWNHSSSSYSN